MFKSKVNSFNVQQKKLRSEQNDMEMIDRSPASSSFSFETDSQISIAENMSIREFLRRRLQKSWKRNAGLAYMLGAQFFNCAMSVTITILELEGNNGKGFHPLQVLFIRMGITVFLGSIYMASKKIEGFPFGAKQVRPLLFLRAFGGFFGVFGMYYSLMYLPLADATVITFLSPVIACAVCSYILHEPFGLMEQIAAFISLLGVVLIAQPSVIFDYFRHSPSMPKEGLVQTRTVTNATDGITSGSTAHIPTSQEKVIAIGVALLGVAGGSVVITTLRLIAKRAHPLITVNYFAVWVTIVSAVSCALIPSIGFAAPTNFKEWALLIMVGICGFTSQTMSATGMQYEKSSRATNMIYTQMIFALLADKVIFGRNPEALSMIGSTMILGSAIFVAVRTQVAKDDSDDAHGFSTLDEERGLIHAIDHDEADDRSMAMQEVRR